ncbi:hypothetical protein [Flavobacterium alvei]|uniref:hypothetical protein n=1 Tax=Flavobacterium alvei TaxID=2080416 RepID=UPI0026F14E78|nr:hypothetical protein [Flavobacterium alvei]
MKNIKFILLVVTVLFICSCKEINKPIPKQTIYSKTINEPNPRQAIRDLVVKFPQLVFGKSSKDSVFKLIRTVIDGETKVQIQLYSQGKRIKNKHQIIVFINANKKCIAIPLFNNSQRDYWQFENEKTTLNVVKVNTTFEKEYNDAISILKKENTVKNVFLETNITIELFQSVLHIQPIQSFDGSLEMCKLKQAVSDIPVEDEESVKERFERNYEDIEKNLVMVSFFYDINSNRIYGISYDEKKHKFIFKNYRQDFGSEPIKPIYL